MRGHAERGDIVVAGAQWGNGPRDHERTWASSFPMRAVPAVEVLGLDAHDPGEKPSVVVETEARRR